MYRSIALPVAENDWTLEDFRKSAAVLLKSLATLSGVSGAPGFESTRRLAGLLSRIPVSISTQFKIAALFTDSVLLEAARLNPRLPFKHLTLRYLIRKLPISVCAECFFHHYDRLRSILPVWLLRKTLLDELTLVELEENGSRFAITMCLSKPYDREGELSLNLVMGDKIIYVMSFSIVPGRIAEADDRDIFMITRLQGAKGCHRELSQASKTLCDVGPVALLLAALQALANAFGIGTMACISGVKQVSYDEQYAGSFQRSYDDFFRERGIPLNSAGFFVTPLPLKEKSLEDIKRGHKIRTREKRAFRRNIQQACADFLARHGLPPVWPEAASLPEEAA